MTTREVYFKAYMNTDKPKGMLFYMREIYFPNLKKKVPQVFSTPWLKFCEDCHENNINRMETIEKETGFMFWNIDDKSDEYAKKVSERLDVNYYNIGMMTKS
jgi:hypothetical protein